MASDADLVVLARSGNDAAFAELYARHRGIALGVAHTVAGAAYADDLVAEAFARVLTMLRDGRGPTEGFRPYLLTTLRNVHLNNVRTTKREDLVADHTTLSDEPTVGDGIDDRLDNDAIGRAFRALPGRWQTVLWMTAVEGRSNDEVALHLGIKANAVAALSFRAREGLRETYLADHLAAAPDGACARVIELLPSYLRDSITARRRRIVEDHLDACHPCHTAVAELTTINTNLGAVLAPVVLGVLAAKVSGGATWLKTAGAVKGAAALPGGNALLVGLGAAKGVAVAAAVIAAVGVGLSHVDIDIADVGGDQAAASGTPERNHSGLDPSAPSSVPDKAPADITAPEPGPAAAQPSPEHAPSPGESPRPREAGTAAPADVPRSKPGLSLLHLNPAPNAKPTPASKPTPLAPLPDMSLGAISWTNHPGVVRAVIPVDHALEGSVITVTASRVLLAQVGDLSGTGWTCSPPELIWIDGALWASSRITCTHSGTGTGRLPVRYHLAFASAPLGVRVVPPVRTDPLARELASTVILRA
jgi:RNA polymerase sigma factor (sigma-70 family)